MIFVTGAHGSGKTTTYNNLAHNPSVRIVAFDMDSLLAPASALTGKSIQTSPETWPAYNQLWLGVMQAVSASGFTPVLFTPASPTEIDPHQEHSWILLDCHEDILQERLIARDWGPNEITDALNDALLLRNDVETRIDTSLASPVEVARELVRLIHRL